MENKGTVNMFRCCQQTTCQDNTVMSTTLELRGAVADEANTFHSIHSVSVCYVVCLVVFTFSVIWLSLYLIHLFCL